jgi:hypothetical protein
MASFKTGDRVRIIEREVTTADVKSQLYYEYFRNLVGVVEHVYDDDTISLKVDLDSLPVDIEKRHHEVEASAQRRWMSNISEEQKDKLSEKEKLVTMSYNILVSTKDLEPAKGKAKPRPKADEPILQSPDAGEKGSTRKPAAEKRPTESDIEKAEEEYLKSIASKKG